MPEIHNAPCHCPLPPKGGSKMPFLKQILDFEIAPFRGLGVKKEGGIPDTI